MRAARWRPEAGHLPARLPGRLASGLRARLPFRLRARLPSRLRTRLQAVHDSRDSGQVTLLILGFTLVAAMLIVGTVAVTSVQLSRMRLLDAADGAALDAADSLDAVAYQRGLGRAIPVSDETVRSTAEAYLADRPLPVGMLAWEVAAGTGSPDGQSAVVRLVGEADLPLVGGVLRGLGGSVTLTVESRARSQLE